MPTKKMVIIGIAVVILLGAGFIFFSKDLIEKGASRAMKSGKMQGNTQSDS